MEHVTSLPNLHAKSRCINPIKWLLHLDRAYREAQQLKSTADHHLKDMGITRREANAVFLRRFSGKNWYAND